MSGPGAPPPRRGRHRHGLLVAAVALGVLVLDQVTKSLALAHLAAGPVHLIGPLSLALAFNTGIAFSLGASLPGAIVALGAVLVAALAVSVRLVRSPGTAVAVGLLLGGALGNLADRLVRANHGAVVDFVHLGFWPTFNLADVAVVSGCALLALRAGRRGGRRFPAAESGGALGDE